MKLVPKNRLLIFPERRCDVVISLWVRFCRLRSWIWKEVK